MITYSGKGELINFEITAELTGGEITQNISKQRLKYDTLAAMIYCSRPTGGYCSPVYLYQWELSSNAINWQEIPGATEAFLPSKGRLKQPVFYRRRVTEKYSGTVSYSTIATVFVDAETR